METDLEYVGFWARSGAFLIDCWIICLVTWPILFYAYGYGYFFRTEVIAGPLDFLLSWALPITATIAFWKLKQATPGKMVFKAKIVDALGGEAPNLLQCIVRNLSYWVAFLPLGAGIFWIAFDPRRQGWHDKLARTVVVRPRQQQSGRRAPMAVAFAPLPRTRLFKSLLDPFANDF